MTRFATAFLGDVDAFEGESITTRFFLAGPVLIPLASYYRTSKGDLHQVPLDKRSVRLAWVRTYAGLGAIFLGIGALFALDGTTTGWRITLTAGPAAALLAALWFMASVRWGAVSDDDARKRTVLQRGTGISGFPRMLPEEVAGKVYADLQATWKRRYREWGGRRRWQKSVGDADLDEDTRQFLACLAAYEAVAEGEAPAELAQQAWHAVGIGEPPPEPEEEPPSERRARGATIKMECPHCARVSRVPSAYAGRRGLCPSCRRAIQVPGNLALSQSAA